MSLASILRTQWAEVATVLEQVGLSVVNFDRAPYPTTCNRAYGSEDDLVDRVSLKGTEYYFQFDRDDRGQHVAVCCPGFGKVIDREWTTTWDRQFERFRQWVDNLVAELNAPDPWEQVQQYSPGFEAGDSINEPNTQFSYPEVEVINGALDKFELNLREQLSLTQVQILELSREVHGLKEAAKKQGRLYWRRYFIGTVVTLAAKWALSQIQWAMLLGIVRDCFGSTVRLIGML